MLSSNLQKLIYLNAALYGLLGALLFLRPEQIAPDFAWRVTPFITMTIGGWCLGNAWLCWSMVRRWQWPLVYPGLVYLALFGPTELIVLLVFRDRLVLEHPIAWLYVVTLAVNAATALFGAIDVSGSRPSADTTGPRTSTLHIAGNVLFVLFVGFLSVYGLFAQIGDPGTNGGIFPEVMSLFTLRAFGVFYLSVACAVVPLIWDRGLRTWLSTGYIFFGVLIMTLLAGIFYIRLFDFVERTGGIAYIAAYLIVIAAFTASFLKHGTGIGPLTSNAAAS